MTPEKINKKIAELLHSRLNLINGELLSSEELQKEVEGAAKEITDKVFKEISALPTIKGWAARDGSPVNAQDLNIGKLKIWPKVPYRNRVGLFWMPNFPQDFAIMMLPSDLFPDLRWADEPIEVEISIIRK